MSEPKCPYCGKKYVIKKGTRRTKHGTRQVYFCKVCKRKFSDSGLEKKMYSPQVVYHSLVYYNLGYTLEETSKLVNKRFKVKTSASTVHNWITEFSRLCPINRIKQEVLDGYGHGEEDEKPLLNNVFEHQELEYKFMCHKGKLNRIADDFPGLANYVVEFGDSCPDEFFETEGRCSQPLFEVDAELRRDKNFLCKVAKFSVKAARTNYQRHELVEKFLLVNDLATIACEVPVWYWEKSVDRGITGHIDILQVRNGRVYIVDYKPKAHKEKKAHRQLYHYASALSFRSGVPLSEIRCAWFDQNNYYEYSPSKAKVSLIRNDENE